MLGQQIVRMSALPRNVACAAVLAGMTALPLAGQGVVPGQMATSTAGKAAASGAATFTPPEAPPTPPGVPVPYPNTGTACDMGKNEQGCVKVKRVGR
jgi:hypothetical protein